MSIRLDMQEGEQFPIGFHYGFVVNALHEPLEKYWCLRIPIPFSEHHIRSYTSDSMSMHKCHFIWFMAKQSMDGQYTLVCKRLGFVWAEMLEYRYCATNMEDIIERNR